MLLLALALLPAACGEEGQVSDTVVLSYGRVSPEHDVVLRELAARFEAGHPGVRVQLHPLPVHVDFQRLFYLRSLGGGSRFVDVFEAEAEWVAELAHGGALVTPPEPPAELAPPLPVRQSVSFRGRMEAVPGHPALSLLYYRTDLLEKHSVAVPGSLEELAEASARIGQAEGIGGFAWPGVDHEDLTCVFLETYQGMGGRVRLLERGIFLEGQVVRRALGFLVTLVDSGASPDWVLGLDAAQARKRFLAGEVAFLRDWDGFLAQARSDASPRAADVAVAVLPGRKGDGGTSTLGGTHLAVSRRAFKSPHAERLAEFLATPESQGLMAERLGRLPASPDARRPAVWQGGAGTVLDQALAVAIPRPATPYYHDLSRIIREELLAALHHEKSVDAAADKLVERVRAVPPEREEGGASGLVLPTPVLLFQEEAAWNRR